MSSTTSVLSLLMTPLGHKAAAGERGESLQNATNIGSYWSSKYSSECNDETSFGHNFGVDIQELAEYSRYYGLTIRPVIRK